MNTKPWRDWIPGVLAREQVRTLCEEGFLQDASTDGIDHSSIDLFLSDEAYMLPGAVKPCGDKFLHRLKKAGLATDLESSEDGVYQLQERRTYLFKLRERLSIGDDSLLFGQATAKSSIGRMDILARLVVDGSHQYEGFTPKQASTGTGDLFLEITPLTFPVSVTAGLSLSQLRLFYGNPEVCTISGGEVVHSLLRGDEVRADGTLSVDLRDDQVSGNPVGAFSVQRGQVNSSEFLPLSKKYAIDPCRFWRFHRKDDYDRLQINPDSFYILRSRERLELPGGIAVYCRATDETLGEMRIHYAGFVHPFFGMERGDGREGTPLIFEVRGHDIPVSLLHGETMARLTFYRMSRDSSNDSSGDTSAYNAQELKLSTFFEKWPDKLNVGEDGSVSRVV